MTVLQVAVRDVRFVCAILLSALPAAATATPESPRKASHRAMPAHVSHSAPDVTGTVVKPQAERLPAPAVPTAADDVIPPPFKLPAASRERVRACGLVWRDMKMAGRTGDDDWRDFAEKCFVAKDAPSSTP